MVLKVEKMSGVVVLFLRLRYGALLEVVWRELHSARVHIALDLGVLDLILGPEAHLSLNKQRKTKQNDCSMLRAIILHLTGNRI